MSIKRLLVQIVAKSLEGILQQKKMGSSPSLQAYGDRDAPFVTDADLAIAWAAPCSRVVLRYRKDSKLLSRLAPMRTPGYGFLSEMQGSQAVSDAGLTWIGPPAAAAMGDKLAAKETMVDAEVPTLPSIEEPTNRHWASAKRSR